MKSLSTDNGPAIASACVNLRPMLLIVEDDGDIRDQLKFAFASHFEVFEAEDKHCAVSLMKSLRPPIVTLDLGLPPSCDPNEGLAALEEFLTIDPLTKVIVMTGSSNPMIARKAMELGAYDYIEKPVQIDMFTIILQRAAYRHRVDIGSRCANQPMMNGLLDMVGESPAMQSIFTAIRRLAGCDLPVLITGETGTGKGLAARAIHAKSPRHEGPFVAINCGAIPESLIESELFGHEKGAFTGAHMQRKGRIEAADGGTLFLDEIGELPEHLQVKLLHVLEGHHVVRVGGGESVSVNIRVIAATNRDLDTAIEDGIFRKDLFYRLKVISVTMPPLRERNHDIPLLVHAILQRCSQRLKRTLSGFTPSALKALEAHDWPGNIRELENRIQRAAVMAAGARLTPADLELTPREGLQHAGKTLKEVRESIEKDVILIALNKHRGNITKAAIELDVSRPTLYELIRKYAIKRTK